MERRKPATIIKEIINILKEKPLSLRALETKVNTNDKTIKEYVQLLEDLNLLKIKKVKKGAKTITQAELLQAGKTIK